MGLILTFAGLLAAGYLYGRLRAARGLRRQRERPAGAPPPRPRTGVAWLAIFVVPVAILLLAQMLQSDVLGWVFGLSLMFIAAMLPCIALFFVGARLGGRASRATRG